MSSHRAILLICVILSITLLITDSKPIYNFKKSYVTQLTSFNYNNQVQKIRQNTKYVTIVHFYKYDGTFLTYLLDGKSLKLVEDIDKWTDQYNGVFRIGAVDCDEYPQICKDQGVKTFPTVKVYPPIPMPPVEIIVILCVYINFYSNKSQQIRFRKQHQNIYIVI